MDNECLYLCSTSSALSMGALKCTTHLLPLLRPLHFIINACNKCVTSDLVVIIANNDNLSLFSDSSMPMDWNLNFSKSDETQLEDPSGYQRLIGKLKFLTLTMPDINVTPASHKINLIVSKVQLMNYLIYFEGDIILFYDHYKGNK